MIGEKVGCRRRLESATMDRRGNPQPSWSDVEDLPGTWLLAFGTAGETVAVDRDTATTTATLYLVGGWVDVTAADLIVVRQIEWQIVGGPAQWLFPDGRPAGTVITISSSDEVLR